MPKTRSKQDTFGVGDKVIAKWSGSSLFYNATVLGKTGSFYDVQFEDGSVSSVEPINVKKPVISTKGSQSPARKRTSRKTQGRSSSKGRPSRSRSKRRTSRSSSRSKSRSRRRIKAEVSPIKKVNEKRDQKLKSPSKNLEKPEEIPEINLTEEVSTLAAQTLPKFNLQQTHEVTSKDLETADTSKFKKSDDKSGEQKEKMAINKFQTCIYGCTGAFFQMILVPALCVLIHLTCTEDYCTVLIPPPLPRKFSAYINRKSVFIYMIWILFQAIVFCLPFGNMVEGFPDSGKKKTHVLKYRINGFAELIMSLLVLFLLKYINFPLTFVYSHFIHLIVASVLFSFVFSVWLYFKSFYAPTDNINPKATSGCPPYDFFVGREVQPQIGKVFHIKLFILNVGMISWAVIDVCLVFRTFVDKGCINYPLALTAVFQLIYIINYLWNAEYFLSSTVFQYERVGYQLIIVFFTLIPFFYCIPVLYLVYYRQYVSRYCLFGISALYSIGLYIHTQSNRQKYLFRRNSKDCSLIYLESIPTSDGKQLLMTGLWGFVRHPSKLGDIIIFVAWTLPCGFENIFPYLPAIFVIIYLVYQVLNSERKCELRYGAAWIRYTSCVQSRIFPKVF
ncbi:delta(14)-sterol reductase TM7SF2-like [Tachypleus tridentatus]|uniref:delta(14)-sterol reductase TM7SF2-like n=1 Tax=Tachypleus tridentatus TaxID=6853 RepID=UPI003FCF9A66